MSIRRNLLLAAAVIAAASLATPVRALAATYYVAPNGNDGNNGSQSSPWRTLQKAADTVARGDVVLVEDGTYAPFREKTDGTASQPIVYRALGSSALIDGGGSTNPVSLDGDYITLEGFRVTGGVNRNIVTGATTGVVIDGCTVYDLPSGDGIFVYQADHTSVINCTIYNCGTSSEKVHSIYFNQSRLTGGIDGHVARGNTIYNSGSLSMNGRAAGVGDDLYHGCVIEGNRIFDMPGTGIAVLNCADALVINNLVYDVGSWMMNVAAGGSADKEDAISSFACIFINNTLIDNASSGIALRQTAPQGGGGHIVFNNLTVTANTGNGIRDENSSANMIDSASNLRLDFDNATQLANVFSNWNTSDWKNGTFSLRSGSNAHNAGRQAYQGMTAPGRDIVAVPRPSGEACDIGAYEIDEGASPDDLPSAPQGLNLQIDNSQCVLASWQPVAAGDLSGYILYYDAQSVAQGQTSNYDNTVDVGNQINADVCSLPPGRYYFAVRAIDLGGNMSDYSAERIVDIATVDVIGPVITILEPAKGAQDVDIDTDIRFRVEDGGSGVNDASVAIAINGSAPGDVQFSGDPGSYTVTASPPLPFGGGLDVTVSVTAADFDGNQTSSSWSFTTASLPPEMPNGFVAFAFEPTCVDLQWSANVETDLAGYTIYWGSESGAYTDSVEVDRVTSHTMCNLPAGPYYFRMRARNDVGLLSAPTSERAVDVFDPDLDAPTVVVLNPQSGASDVALDALVSFAVFDDGSGVDLDNVVVLIDGVAPAQTSVSGDDANATFECTPSADFEPNATIAVTVLVNDLASPTNSTASSWSFTTTSVAPATPNGLVATGTATGCANLSWDPNQEPDFDHYVIVFGTGSGVYADSITTTTTARSVCGLTDGTYYFAVRAYNQAGQGSGLSAESSADVTNGNAQGPLPPQGLSVATAGDDCIDASWNPSGEPDVSGYFIHFGRESVADGAVGEYDVTVDVGAQTSYSACGLDPGTYYFAVTAYNSGGGTSGYSTEKSATLVAPDQGGPTITLLHPAQGAVDVPVNASVFISFSDPSGVDEASASIRINGQAPGKVSLSEGGEGFAAACDLAQPLPPNTTVTIEVRASDQSPAANEATRTFTYTTGTAPDHRRPVFPGHFPPDGEDGVDANTNVVVQVQDDGSIDLDRVELYINGESATPDVAIEGAYVMVRRLNPRPLPAGFVQIRVVVFDSAGNRGELTYDFTVASPVSQTSAPSVEIVPNGFWADEPDRPLEIRGVPPGWTVRLFDVAGAQVRSYRNEGSNGLIWIWDFTNGHSRRVAKGLYLVRVFDENGHLQQSGKFIVRSGG